MWRLFFLLFFSLTAQAQIPAYYNGIDFTKTGDSLKWQLATLVTSTHSTPLVYTSASLTDTWDALKLSDLNDTDTTKVLLVYGYDDLDSITRNDRTRSKDSSCHTSGCVGLWNREHIFPQSLANPSMTTQFPGTGTDVHNIRAADGQENSSRGNDMYAFGSGTSGSLSNSTYYPGDEWKGDVARIIMYMYLRYDAECLATNVGAGSTSYSPNGDMPNVFLEWNTSDPPSQYEFNRNNTFHLMQGNRNPFIDNPYLATLIWNGPTANNPWLNLAINERTGNTLVIYPTISNGIIHAESMGKIPTFYTLLNAKGHVLKNGELNSILDFTEFDTGFYYLRVTNRTSTLTTKLILRK